MNKAELIDQVAEKLGSDRRQATAAVEHVVDTIVRAVHKGESVTITGFGVFASFGAGFAAAFVAVFAIQISSFACSRSSSPVIPISALITSSTA